MAVKFKIQSNTFYDSVQLMRIANQLSKESDILDIAVLMGTKQNISSLKGSRLFVEEMKSVSPNDLIIAVEAKDEIAALAAIDTAIDRITNYKHEVESRAGLYAYSLEGAMEQLASANLALLSIPSLYIKEEALKLIDEGLNVMIFSDNVPISHELMIKERAKEKGLLVMGPDCGTAIINGVALAFANKARKGEIGLVGASGTGLQEVSSLIHQLGYGVSHVIGAGGNDVKKDIGGLSTIEGIRRLDRDPKTKVMAIISKPPDIEVAQKILAAASNSSKEVVVLFLGMRGSFTSCSKYHIVDSLEEAILTSISLLKDKSKEEIREEYDALLKKALNEAASEMGKLKPHQKYIRGIYSGGTFTSEASMILSELVSEVYSNAAAGDAGILENEKESKGHSCIDMGADEFTKGKPHPMIEPALRHERILKEARDPSVAALLLDIVIGYGAHTDPAGVLSESILAAKKIAEEDNRHLPVVVFVCGVEEDPQVRSLQEKKLLDCGCIVLPGSTAAARAAACIASRGPIATCNDRGEESFKEENGDALLGKKLEVINVGIKDFHDALVDQEVSSVHYEWRPAQMSRRVKKALDGLL